MELPETRFFSDSGDQVGRAGEVDLRVEIADRHTDVGSGRGKVALGDAHVRPPAQQLRGQPDRHRGRRRRRRGDWRQLRGERLGRLADQHAQRMDLAPRLGFQRRPLRLRRGELVLLLADLEPRRETGLPARLHQRQQLLLARLFAQRDVDLALQRAQGEVVDGDLGGGGNLGVAQRPDLRLDAAARRLDAAPGLAEQVELPGGVEADAVGGEVGSRQADAHRAAASAGAPRATPLAAAARERAGQLRKAGVLGKAGVVDAGAEIDVRQRCGAGDDHLLARLTDLGDFGSHVEVAGQGARDEAVQRRVAELRPPLREIGRRGRGPRRRGRFLVRRWRRHLRRLVVRPDRAAGERGGDHDCDGSENGAPRNALMNARHQCPPPAGAPAGRPRIRKMVGASTMMTTIRAWKASTNDSMAACFWTDW